MPPNSKCTVGLLAIAAQAIYRVKKDNLIDSSTSELYAQTLVDIGERGYAITEAIVPISGEGTGKTPLGALCLMPQDHESPIIISYRGTKTSGDVRSDIRLGITGTVDKEFRDSAFEFYQKIRKENPGREIVLTGHSLGGHLATYVGAKAYNTDSQLVEKPLVQVRTFNTAPGKTTHSSVLDSHPGVRSQFVNYCLSSDVVSDLPLQKYTGNSFVFPCSNAFLKAHPMKAVRTFIPQEILNQSVGTNAEGSKKDHQLIEQFNGLLSSYQCRVEGQFFSRFRSGAKNLAEMQKGIPEALDYIKKGNYDDAVRKLDTLKDKLQGSVSRDVVDVLIKSTINVKANHLMESAKLSEVAPSPNNKQEGIKARLQEVKSEAASPPKKQEGIKTKLQEMKAEAVPPPKKEEEIKVKLTR